MTEPQDPIAAATHRDPYPYYRRLRETQPLYFDEGCGLWVASSAVVVTALLESGHCQIRPVAQPVPPNLAASEIGPVFSALVRMTDGDFQRRMKAAVVASLSQIDARQLQAAIGEGMVALDLTQRANLARLLPEMQYRLPAYVMARLLGIEVRHCRDIAGQVAPFVTALAAGASAARVDQGGRAMRDLLAILATAGEGPSLNTPHLVVALLHEARKQGLSAEQAMANALGFLMQTFDATAGLIGNGFLVQARLAPGSDEADWTDFVDEVLRHDPPVQNTRRVVAADIDIAGCQLKAGDAVLLILAAANRDPAFNPDPEAFRLGRKDRRILTFGHGRHACPGQAIARAVATAVLRQLWMLRQDASEPLPTSGAVCYRPLPNARIPEFAA